MRYFHFHYIVLVFASLFLLFQTTSAQDTVSVYNADKPITPEDVAFVMKIFDGQPVATVISKAEGFINTGKDSLQRAVIAAAMYDYYESSKIMGYEEVALYIADNYFLNHLYKCPDDDKYMMMRLFAEFNRASMIGLQAPEMLLSDINGSYVSIRSDKSTYKILFFYDDECPTCIRQAPILMEYLQGVNDIEITLFRIYTQKDRDKWTRYVSNLSSRYTLPQCIRVVDVWDPEILSDFPKLYGVVSTPQIFVLDYQNKIIGRRLTPKAVSQLIDIYQNQATDQELLFDSVFPSARNYDEVKQSVDAFFKDTQSDPDNFHETFYSLYQYLKNSNDYNLQMGAAYLGKEYIVSVPKMWEGVTFTPTGRTHGSTIRGTYSSVNDFVKETEVAIDLFWRNPLGEPVADLHLFTPDKKPFSIYDANGKYTVLYFYSMNCPVCDAATEEMRKIYDKYASKGIEFITIYVGSDKKWKKYIKDGNFAWISLQDKNGQSGMFQKYNLSSVPVIYLLDKDKRALAKDLNPLTLEQILEVL